MRAGLAALLLFSAAGWSQATFPPPVGSALYLAVVPGTSGYAVVAVEVPEGWAIQAHRPTLPHLIPTVLTVDPVPGVRFGDVIYPQPERKHLAFARRELEVYTGEVLFLTPFTVALDAPPGVRRVRAELQYQACSSSACLLPEVVVLEIVLYVLPLERLPGRGAAPEGFAALL